MTHSKLTGRDLIAALGVVLIWGSNFVAMKFALHDFTALQLGAARYVFAVLPLILIIRPPRMHWKWVVLYGLSQGVGQFGLLFIALQVGMTAALASVLLQTQVFFTALFGFAFLHERPNRPLQIGLVLAALGLACFGLNYLAPSSTANAALATTTPLGFILSLGAASLWALSNIVVRRAQQSTPHFEVLPFMVWSSLIPILPFIGMTLFRGRSQEWLWERQCQASTTTSWNAFCSHTVILMSSRESPSGLIA